jgi:drug/metabolite transporter (DMT)-like permease
VAGWSFSNTIVKIADAPALTFAFYRLWLGALVMLAALTIAGRRLTWRGVRASAAGGALLGVEIMFFFTALKRTSVADVLIISALQPALTLTVAGRLFGERVTRREIGWTAASLVGVALVTVGSSGTPAWSLAGDLLAVGSLFCWTSYFLVSKHVRASVPALEYMTAVTVVAAIVVTPMALLTHQPLGSFHGTDWLWVCLFLAGAQGGHLLVAWAHPQVDVSVSSLLMLAQPILSGIAALVVLGEPLTGLEIAGGLVVVAAVSAIVLQATRSGRGEPAAPVPG